MTKEGGDEVTQDTQALVLARITEVDRMDEDQIIQELAGDKAKEYVYSFPMDGKTVRGLSWAGFKELAQRWGNIRIEKPQVEDLGSELRVIVEATDLQNNVTVWAGTHQPKTRRINLSGGAGYKQVPDEFAFEKAISKVQRNVLKNLIPHAVQEAAIEVVLTGKVIPLGRATEDKPTPRLGKPSPREIAAPRPVIVPTEEERTRDTDTFFPPSPAPQPQPDGITSIGSLLTRAVKELGYSGGDAIRAALGVNGNGEIREKYGSLNAAWVALQKARTASVSPAESSTTTQAPNAASRPASTSPRASRGPAGTVPTGQSGDAMPEDDDAPF